MGGMLRRCKTIRAQQFVYYDKGYHWKWIS
jgi:hypothetical protein